MGSSSLASSSSKMDIVVGHSRASDISFMLVLSIIFISVALTLCMLEVRKVRRERRRVRWKKRVREAMGEERVVKVWRESET